MSGHVSARSNHTTNFFFNKFRYRFMRGEKNIDRILAMTPGTPGSTVTYQRMHSNDSDYSVGGSNSGSGSGGNGGSANGGGGQGGTQNTITPSSTGRSSVD